jgi:hypothetical protein
VYFHNETPFETLFTVGYGKDGRERIIVVTKASFHLRDTPGRSGALEPCAQHRALVEADEFEGDPGASAPLRETDFAHYKPACDVFLLGSAYACGQTVTAVTLQVGSWNKSFQVWGPRHWQARTLRGWRISDPKPFEIQSISYGCAWGGTVVAPGRPEHSTYYPENPVGVGYHPRGGDLDGKPAPNTQQPGDHIDSPAGRYRPMSFGPIGRSWLPRRSYTGTYDAAWLANRVPYLPEDFDDRYFQGAPPDQQITYPRGGEAVELLGLTPERALRCVLPRLTVPVLFVPHTGDPVCVDSRVDTILFEPDAGVVSLTARAVHICRRNAFELSDLIIGGNQATWSAKRRAEQAHKTFYPGLGALVRGRMRKPFDDSE